MASISAEQTFSTFVVSRSNRFAHAAARAVADRPGLTYNPLLIYGEPGSGKTHLLKAVAHQVQADAPSIQLHWMTGELFELMLVRAISETATDVYLERIAAADLLIVDSLEYLTGRLPLLRELYVCIQRTVDRGSQALLASRADPDQVEPLPSLLQGRLVRSLIVDVSRVGSPDEMAAAD